MLRVIFTVILCLLVYSTDLYAIQSTIREAQGYSCAGEDKSRKQTEQDALAEAKRLAVENNLSYIKSETKVENFQIEKDIVQAYSNATVRVIEVKERGWYKDERSGDCYKIKFTAEIVPDEKAMNELASKKEFADDPTLPLTVKIWTEKSEYKGKEKIKIFLKGNKPFFARVIYKNVEGELLQLLPNPYRIDNYFNGGVIYEIPSGKDRFDLEVTPPFGEESIIVYASSTELGKINVKPAGAVYKIKTRADDVGVRTRGVQLKEKTEGDNPAEAFYEGKVTVKTAP
jgi:hypothetical protein